MTLILLVLHIITSIQEPKKDEYFEAGLTYVLGSEGGYVNNKYDKGGKTKYGISQASYPKLNIEALTWEEAKKIYYKDYWLKYGLDKIRHKKLAIKVFDTMIVVGSYKGVQLLERAVNHLMIDLPIDGVLDPLLLEVINDYENQEELVDMYQIEMEKFFEAIVQNNPSQKLFLQGWINRSRKEPPKDK
jgi:lysozyme family protein